MSLQGKPLAANFTNPPADPLLLLKQWLQTAEQLNVNEPYDLVLSTVNAEHQSSSRVVLIIDCDDTGVVFGTSEKSRKAKEFAQNPQVAGTLWWRETVQQINFKGKITQLSQERSKIYFAQRPREGQAVSAVVHPSIPMLDEASLRAGVLEQLNQAGEIPCPPEWHAFHMAIASIEFWQGSSDRFHQRLKYDYVKDVWQHRRLQP